MQTRIKRMTISAMCTALGVVILYLGSMVEVMDLTTVFVASFLVVFAIIELGSPWYWLLWLCTSLLSVLWLPNKFCAFEYAFFGGLYPILKYYAEKLPKKTAYILKFVIFNALFCLLVGAMIWFFGMEDITLPVIGKLTPSWYLSIMLLLGNIVFVLYDILLTKLILLYDLRLHARLERMCK